MTRAGYLCILPLLLAPPLRACDTPVYQYALYNWPADFYRATLLHRVPLSAADQRLVDQLEKRAAEANLIVQDHADEPAAADGQQRPRNADLPEHPFLTVKYPLATKLDADAWSGPLTPEAIDSVCDSPLRRQAAERLHKAEVVWLLLESGEKAADNTAAKVVGENRPAVPVSSVLRVRRGDPAERLLVRALLDSEPDLAGRTEPMAFPIFGRGRVLYALVGAGITAENVRRAGDFLGGDCSCTIKRDNPGIDLLLSADWSDVMPADVEIPAATGTVIDRNETQGAAPPSPSGSWSRGALWVAVVFAGGLVLLTGTLVLRSRKQPPHTAPS